MIYDLSVRLTSRLGKRGYLPDSEEEIVAYGLFSLLSKLMYAVICLVTGLVFGICVESMIFYAVFLFVKKYGGGFHASTEGRCMIISTAEILLSVCFVFFALREPAVLKSGVLASAAAYIIICILSPAAAKEKPLDNAENPLPRALDNPRHADLRSRDGGSRLRLSENMRSAVRRADARA